MTTQEMQERLEEVRGLLIELGERDVLSEEEAREFDTLDSEETELRERIEEAERRAARVAEVRANADAGRTLPGAYLGTEEQPGAEERRVWDLDQLRRSTDVSDLASRARDAVGAAPGLTDEHRESALGRLSQIVDDLDTDDLDEVRGASRAARHIVAVSSPEYRQAWRQMVKNFSRTGTVVVPDAVQRAASLTDASGGYAVPLPVDPTLILNDDGSVNPFRAISTVRTATTDVVRTVNSTAVTASWDGEAAEVSDDTPTWANIDITVHKAQAFVPFSIEIGQDYPGFEADIRMLLTDARDNLEATAFATGTGTNQPIGIVTALTGGSYEVSSNTTDTFAIGDVYDLDEELPSRFSTNATWVANKKIYQAIREAGGANLDDFWANLGQGRPNLLLGHPAVESSAMDGAIDAMAENYVLVLGDFSNYRIYDRVGLSIELVPHLFATANNRPSGQRGFYAYWRVGADSVNDRAFRLLNVT